MSDIKMLVEQESNKVYNSKLDEEAWCDWEGGQPLFEAMVSRMHCHYTEDLQAEKGLPRLRELYKVLVNQSIDEVIIQEIRESCGYLLSASSAASFAREYPPRSRHLALEFYHTMIELILRYGLEFMVWNTDLLKIAPEYERENYYRDRLYQAIAELIQKVIEMPPDPVVVDTEAVA